MNIFEVCSTTIDKVAVEQSENTARAYRRGLDVFMTYLRNEYSIDTTKVDASSLLMEHFIKFPAWLLKSYRKKTAVVYMSAADYLIERVLTKQRIIRPDVLDWQDYQDEKRQMHKRTEIFIPRDVNEEDIDAMIEAARNLGDKEPRQSRDVAIVLVLSSSGIRNAELCALRCRDISWNSRYKKPFIHVENGKGNKKRDIPFSKEAWEALQTYWKLRGWQAPDDPVIARHDKGAGKRKHKPVTTTTIRNIIHDVRTTSGMESAFTPHYFRHGVATAILRKTGNIKIAKDQLGHSNIATTEAYTHLLKDDLVEAHSKTFGS